MKLIVFIVIACVASIAAEEYHDYDHYDDHEASPEEVREPADHHEEEGDFGPPEEDEDMSQEESIHRKGFGKPYHSWGDNHADNEKYFEHLFGKKPKDIQSPAYSYKSGTGANIIPTEAKEITAKQSLRDDPEVTTKSYTPRSGDDNNYGYRPDSEYPPEAWVEKWPECGGTRQSPINLALPACEKDYGPPLQSVFFKKHPHTTTIRNLGHTVQYSFSYIGTPPILTGGFLDAEYLFAQLHFHFGSSDYSGSEHSLNSVTYPMEMHLVFYNAIYNDTQEASQHADGLLVLGLFFQVLEKTPNQRFALYLSDVPTDGTEIRIENPRSHRLFDFVGSMDFHYATYEGSLTTPPCSEAVTWILSTRPREISRQDLDTFRALQGYEGPMMDNFRPIQSINGRSCAYH
ncbi:carbonic anhydrase-like [Phlebotomus argentipes]|uniref:carbonic anhydrase-like n=1 Tax=Phlebotomus argentipes TaxID=94469 RepID=UPI002892A2AF|nr:carbonic anhydrase-like [Phlebotomus argentipes]